MSAETEIGCWWDHLCRAAFRARSVCYLPGGIDGMHHHPKFQLLLTEHPSYTHSSPASPTPAGPKRPSPPTPAQHPRSSPGSQRTSARRWARRIRSARAARLGRREGVPGIGRRECLPSPLQDCDGDAGLGRIDWIQGVCRVGGVFAKGHVHPRAGHGARSGSRGEYGAVCRGGIAAGGGGGEGVEGQGKPSSSVPSSASHHNYSIIHLCLYGLLRLPAPPHDATYRHTWHHCIRRATLTIHDSRLSVNLCSVVASAHSTD